MSAWTQESGLVHTVIGTVANVHDINAAEALLHGQETDVYADAGYQGIEKRCKANPVRWHIAMRPGRRRQLDLNDRLDAIFDQIERLKAGIRAKVEHPFRVLKQQFGYTKTRYRGLMKNTAQITTLFALGQPVDSAQGFAESVKCLEIEATSLRKQGPSRFKSQTTNLSADSYR
jgi:IS5 family transposase